MWLILHCDVSASVIVRLSVSLVKRARPKPQCTIAGSLAPNLWRPFSEKSDPPPSDGFWLNTVCNRTHNMLDPGCGGRRWPRHGGEVAPDKI